MGISFSKFGFGYVHVRVEAFWRCFYLQRSYRRCLNFHENVNDLVSCKFLCFVSDMDQPIDENIDRLGRVSIVLKYLPWINFFRFIILRGLENSF